MRVMQVLNYWKDTVKRYSALDDIILWLTVNIL